MKIKTSLTILIGCFAIFLFIMLPIFLSIESDKKKYVESFKGSEFSLKDMNNNIITEKSFEGSLTAIFFGFTNCPDICPMHLSVLAGAYNNLPVNMQRDTKIIFVSAEPERDKEKISSWTQQFHKDFIGVTGNEKNLTAFQNALKIPAAVLEKESTNSENYAVSHASWITVFTKDNLAHFIYPLGITQKEWVTDLEIIHKNKWEANK